MRLSSIEAHFDQQRSSLPEWEESFVERCHHLLQKWPAASLVPFLSFVSQWMEWSEERGAVKDTDAKNITNEQTKNQNSLLKAAKLQCSRDALTLRVSNYDILQKTVKHQLYSRLKDAKDI